MNISIPYKTSHSPFTLFSEAFYFICYWGTNMVDWTFFSTIGASSGARCVSYTNISFQAIRYLIHVASLSLSLFYLSPFFLSYYPEMTNFWPFFKLGLKIWVLQLWFFTLLLEVLRYIKQHKSSVPIYKYYLISFTIK